MLYFTKEIFNKWFPNISVPFQKRLLIKKQKDCLEIISLVNIKGVLGSIIGNIGEIIFKELVSIYGMGQITIYEPEKDIEGIDFIVKFKHKEYLIFIQVKCGVCSSEKAPYIEVDDNGNEIKKNSRWGGWWWLTPKKDIFPILDNFYIVVIPFLTDKYMCNSFIYFIPSNDIPAKGANTTENYKLTFQNKNSIKWDEYLIPKASLGDYLFDLFDKEEKKQLILNG